MAVVTNWKLHVYTMLLPLCLLITLCFKTSMSLHESPGIPGIDISKIKDEKDTSRSSPDPHGGSRPSPGPHTEPADYYPMHAGRELLITGNGRNKLNVFCYRGEAKTLLTIFKTIELCLDIDGDDFRYYDGPNSTVVRQEHQESSWLAFYPWRPKTYKLELYKQSCIGIETSKPYKMILRARWVDFWRVVTLVSAVVTFYTAVHLARNVFFHYTTGITFGVLCSLLILVYVVARMLPKKSSAVAVMVGGWGLVVYTVQHLWQNFLTVLKEHHAVAIGYVVVVGLVSFAAVYRYGPLTDQRSINLVQWGMQLSALLALFLCSQYREATLGIAIVMVSCYSIPDKWKAKLRTFWVRRFPPKVRRLTEEEYIQQANEETRRALEELREFCRSPKCDKWKVVSKLSTPHRFVEFVGARNSRQRGTSNKAQNQRFAEFVEGGSHLDDEAILAYESNDLRVPRDGEADDDDLYMTTDSEGELDNELDENGEMT